MYSSINAFLPSSNIFFVFSHYPVLATFDATSNYGGPAIVGFVNPEFWDRTQQERKRAVLEDLTRFFGPDALHAIDYQVNFLRDETA